MIQKLQKKFALSEQGAKDLVKGVRNLRTEMDVPPSRKAKIFIVADDAALRETFEKTREAYQNLAGASDVSVQAGKNGIEDDAVSVVIPGATLYLPLGRTKAASPCLYNCAAFSAICGYPLPGTKIISALDNTPTGERGTKYLEEFFDVIRFQFPTSIKDVGDLDKFHFNKCWLETKQEMMKQRRK